MDEQIRKRFSWSTVWTNSPAGPGAAVQNGFALGFPAQRNIRITTIRASVLWYVPGTGATKAVPCEVRMTGSVGVLGTMPDPSFQPIAPVDFFTQVWMFGPSPCDVNTDFTVFIGSDLEMQMTGFDTWAITDQIFSYFSMTYELLD